MFKKDIIESFFTILIEALLLLFPQLFNFILNQLLFFLSLESKSQYSSMMQMTFSLLFHYIYIRRKTNQNFILYSMICMQEKYFECFFLRITIILIMRNRSPLLKTIKKIETYTLKQPTLHLLLKPSIIHSIILKFLNVIY